MSFITPLFLSGGLLIALPILLHFLRKRSTKPIPFPSLQFLLPALLKESRRHQIRRWIVLLLRCLAILLVALIFARPGRFLPQLPPQQVTLVVLDNSMSMQATDTTHTLRNWAQGAFDSWKKGDQGAILLLYPEPHWLVPMTSDRDLLRQTLNHWNPDFESGGYSSGWETAIQFLELQEVPRKNLWWVGDHQKNAWGDVSFQNPIPDNITLHFPPLPVSPRKQASLRFKNFSRQTDHLEVTYEVQSWTSSPTNRIIETSLDGKLVKREEIDLQEILTITTTIPLSSSPGPHRIKITLDADDQLADNTLWVWDADSGGASVFLSPLKESDTDFLSIALESGRSVQPFQLGTLDPHQWPKSGTVILRGETLPDQNASDFLKRGGQIWLTGDGGAKLNSWLNAFNVKVESLTSPAFLQSWDMEHSLLALFQGRPYLALMQLESKGGLRLIAPQAEPIAKWSDGSTAIAEIPCGTGRLFFSGFTTTRSETPWITDSTFTPLIHQTLVYLTQAQTLQSRLHVSQILPLETSATQWIPSETLRPTPPTTDLGRAPHIPGLYERKSPQGSSYFIVESDPRESDPAPWPTPQDWSKFPRKKSEPPAQDSASTPHFSTQPQGIDWGPWIALFLLILILIELQLANKTSP